MENITWPKLFHNLAQYIDYGYKIKKIPKIVLEESLLNIGYLLEVIEIIDKK